MLGKLHQISLEPLQFIANMEISSLSRLTDFGLPAIVRDNITDKLYSAIKSLREQYGYMISEL